jgi:hypothetical protein
LALDKAHQMMMSELLARSKDKDNLTKALINSIAKTNAISAHSVELSREYRDYLGLYGDKNQIVQGNGQLQVIIKGNHTFDLSKIDNDLFSMQMTGGGKVRFERNAQGNITGYSLYRPHTSKWTFTKRKV